MQQTASFKIAGGPSPTAKSDTALANDEALQPRWPPPSTGRRRGQQKRRLARDRCPTPAEVADRAILGHWESHWGLSSRLRERRWCRAQLRLSRNSAQRTSMRRRAAILSIPSASLRDSAMEDDPCCMTIGRNAPVHTGWKSWYGDRYSAQRTSTAHSTSSPMYCDRSWLHLLSRHRGPEPIPRAATQSDDRDRLVSADVSCVE